MRFPPGPGVWPAFWLATLKPAKDASPGVEIDAVEYYGHSDATFSSALHVWYKGADKDKTSLRLFFDLTSARLIPTCMITDRKVLKSRGPVEDLWDRGFSLFADPSVRMSNVLLLVVTMLLWGSDTAFLYRGGFVVVALLSIVVVAAAVHPGAVRFGVRVKRSPDAA